jgi:hypothetical protein
MSVYAPRTGPLAPGVSNACGGQVEAFTYPYEGTNSVIILCSDWSGAALNSYDYPDAEAFRLVDFTKVNVVATVFGINFFSGFLVYKLVHEIMHAADGDQC